jgi:hypothetical protein
MLLAALTGGCTTPLLSPSRFVVDHRPGEEAGAETTAGEATCTLYHWKADPQDAPYEPGPEGPFRQPWQGGEAVRLAAKVRVGFVKREDGQLAAVAGEKTVPVPDGRYVWLVVQKPDHVREALTRVGIVVCAPFILAGVLVMMIPLCLLGAAASRPV